MRKIFLFLIIIITFIVSIIPIATASDVLQTKKHITMVYDDSTSMYYKEGSREPVLSWAYANYMTQAFCALLNPEDSLYIEYMSDVDNETVSANLMELDTDNAISTIRQHTNSITKTPITVVESAYSKLLELDESLKDEYWLVILTDGEFTDFADDVTEKLNEYIDNMASVGKTLKVVFFAIGDAPKLPTEDTEKGLFVYTTGTNEIVSTMAQVADNISGRHNISSNKMNVLSGNRLVVDMLLPVRSLIVFYQQQENSLRSISNNNDDEMELSSISNIQAPNSFALSSTFNTITDENAFGSIIRIVPSQQGDILSNGRYILGFEKQIILDDIRVMYEPAIDVIVQYKKDGKIVLSPKDGDIVDIEIALVDAQKGDLFNNNILPVPVECNIQITTGGEIIRNEDGFVVEDVKLINEDMAISTQITMPGYFTLRNRHDFIEEKTVETPTATPVNYEENQGPWPPEVKLVYMPPFIQSIQLNELEDSPPFLFVPFFNDEKGKLRDLELGNLEIICSREIMFEVVINEQEMGYDIYPKYSGGLLTTSTGIITANIIFQSEYDKIFSTSLTFIINDLSWFKRNLINFIIITVSSFFIIITLGVLVLRKKFHKESWIEYIQEIKTEEGAWLPAKQPAHASLQNLKGRWRFIPFTPERINIIGITFIASIDDQIVKIPKKCVKENMSTARGPLTRRKDYQKSFLLKTGVRIFVEQGTHGNQRIAIVYHGPKKSMLKKKKNNKKDNRK